MATKPDGYGLMRLGGMERPFYVGTEQGIVFCGLNNRRTPDGARMSLKAYSELFNPLTKPQDRISGEDLRDFVFSALKEGAEEDGLLVDFTPRMVSRWIDESEDATEASKPMVEFYRQMQVRAERQHERLKNAQPPKEGGKVKKLKPTL